MPKPQEIQIVAEMVGNVMSVDVATGDAVAIGDTVIWLESMKMEIPVIAEHAGTVGGIFVT
ncbi:MAG: acetyl-CoA carboxylase biotin carboxyl carrier protein subunit, partial [Nocardioides sp.]